MRQYETPAARDAARVIRRFAFGYLGAWAVMAILAVGVVLFVIASFVVLGWLAMSPSGASPLPVPKVSTRTAPTCDPPNYVVRPQMIFLDCMLTDAVLAGPGVPFWSEKTLAHNLQWQTWGPQTATATGALWYNSCAPNCADGTWFMEPAQVQLGGLTITSCGRLFSTLSYRWATGAVVPSGLEKTLVWHPWVRAPLPINCK
jgi:hypothetical protein